MPKILSDPVLLARALDDAQKLYGYDVVTNIFDASLKAGVRQKLASVVERTIPASVLEGPKEPLLVRIGDCLVMAG